MSIPRGVWLVGAALALLASLPYLVGYLNAPEGGAFTGNAVAQVQVDYHSHLAKMHLGARGGWLYRILFTHQEHPAVFVQTFYIALGHVARLTGLPPDAVYHLARIAAVLAMTAMIWRFAARFLAGEDARARWTALLLATVTGGLGWVFYFLAPAQTANLAPIEFWLIDAYTFTAALTFPHLAAAIAALLAFFLVMDRWRRAPTWGGTAWAALLSLLIASLQPFDLLLTGLVVATLVLWDWWRARRIDWRQAAMLVPVVAAHVLPTLYNYAALQGDPVWQSFTAQNITASPPPVYYLLGYAWLLVPVALRLADEFSRRNPKGSAGAYLPAVWALWAAVLVYVPLQMQRRFLLGVQVPLAVLAAVGLARLSARRGRLLFAAFLGLSAISHVMLLASAAGAANPAARPALFVSADEAGALDYLRAQPEETVVFATFAAGSKITGQTGRRTYIGHWIETPDFEAKQAQVERFFKEEKDTGMDDAARRALLAEVGADYLWYGPTARALGGWAPDFLAPVYTSDTVTLYEVGP